VCNLQGMARVHTRCHLTLWNTWNSQTVLLTVAGAA
jgi:hypothetical protein